MPICKAHEIALHYNFIGVSITCYLLAFIPRREGLSFLELYSNTHFLQG